MRCGEMSDRQIHDFLQSHRRVTEQPAMLRRDLPGAVLELPRRIGKNGREAPFDFLKQIIGRRWKCGANDFRHKDSS